MAEKKQTPVRAIRQRCLDCSGFTSKEVRDCSFNDCPLHEYRSGHRPKEGALRTPMKAIRAHCVECCNGNVREANLCTAKMCPLHAFRTGKKPKRYNPPLDEEKTIICHVAPHFLTNTGTMNEEGVNLC